MTTGKVVSVQVGQITSMDIQLAIKSAAASIEISDQLSASKPTYGQHLVRGHLAATGPVPNPGNDLTFYALLAPGVQMSTNGGYGNFSTFGLPATSNTFTINGAINNDIFSQRGQHRRYQPDARIQCHRRRYSGQ